MKQVAPLAKAWLSLAAALLFAAASAAVTGDVVSEHKIGEGFGGFPHSLVDGDRFGRAVAPLGDLDGDGFDDLVVTAVDDDEDGSDAGAAWILFLNANGTVKSAQKLNTTQGSFGAPIKPGSRFGSSIASLGRPPGAGLVRVAIGARGALSNQGEVWIADLGASGATVADPVLIESGGGRS